MLLFALAATAQTPAECRHAAIAALTKGRWTYVVNAPGDGGMISQKAGSVMMRETKPGVLEATYPGENRAGFRLERTRNGYRSISLDPSDTVAADIRVVSCTKPDENGVLTIVEVADDEPGAVGTRVASYSTVTASPDAIMFSTSERPVASAQPYVWQYSMLLLQTDR